MSENGSTFATENKTHIIMQKKKNAQALDDMEKAIAKQEKAAKAEANRAARLASATARLNALRTERTTVGLANQSLADLHTLRANAVSVQGLIDACNALIKEVAATALDKAVVKALKSTAAQVILDNVNEETLPLYVDAKGLYKTEAAYRLVASKAHNSEVRTLLNNMKKKAGK